MNAREKIGSLDVQARFHAFSSCFSGNYSMWNARWENSPAKIGDQYVSYICYTASFNIYLGLAQALELFISSEAHPSLNVSIDPKTPDENMRERHGNQSTSIQGNTTLGMNAYPDFSGEDQRPSTTNGLITQPGLCKGLGKACRSNSSQQYGTLPFKTTPKGRKALRRPFKSRRKDGGPETVSPRRRRSLNRPWFRPFHSSASILPSTTSSSGRRWILNTPQKWVAFAIQPTPFFPFRGERNNPRRVHKRVFAGQEKSAWTREFKIRGRTESETWTILVASALSNPLLPLSSRDSLGYILSLSLSSTPTVVFFWLGVVHLSKMVAMNKTNAILCPIY